MRKKILIIINNLGVGGAERVAVDDINEMLKNGCSVKLITLKKEFKRSFMSELNLGKENIECITFKNFRDISSWKKIVLVIKNFKPDIVVTHLWYSNFIGRIASVLSGVKTVPIMPLEPVTKMCLLIMNQY